MKNTYLNRLFDDLHMPQFLAALYILAILLDYFLQETVKQVKYLDEVSALLLGLVFLVCVIKERKIHKDELIIILLSLVMLCLGLFSNFRSGLVHSKYLWVLDAFNMFKFIAASIGAVRLFSNTKHNEYIIKYLAFFAEVIIAYASIFLFINLFKDINMTSDIRYGFRTYNFVFNRVGTFYEVCLYILMIFFADLYVEKRKITWVFIFLTMVNMASTFRSRAFIYAALFIFFYIVFVLLKLEKIKLRYMVPIVFAAAVTFAGQFAFYFSGNKARNVLLRYGVKTMLAYCPFGAGFGTYGTAVAQQHYSKLYHRYSFWRFYGTSMKNRSFLLDDYWPAVMAELGIIGAVCMLVVILLLFRRNVKMCNNVYSRVCVYSCWIAIILSSAVSSSFMAGTNAMIFAALVGVFTPLVAEKAEPRPEIELIEKIKKRVSGIPVRKRLVIIVCVLTVFCGAVLGIRYRSKIKQKLFPAPTVKNASITVDTEEMIYDGSAEFMPFTESLELKNARLRDMSFRDKSVKDLREIIGDRYSSLTDAEIEAITGEQVQDGLTKAEILAKAEEGTEPDLSAFETGLTDEERDEILKTSEALNETFDLSGEILSNVLSLTVASANTGNFRDRTLYYYYRTYTGKKLEAKRPLYLKGCHLPAMMLPEKFPVVTRADLKFKSRTKQELYHKYTNFANYLGITSDNGYGGDGNEDITLTARFDKLKSQQVTLKFIHDTLYGIGVNRKFTIRVTGPEITLSEYAVTILKGSDFDPNDYVVSVLDENGKSARNLLEIYNPVDTNRPGFYTVNYKCGDNSYIFLRVKVSLTEDEIIEE